MNKIKKYVIGILVVYILSVTGLFLVNQIAIQNDYNSYQTSCGNTCFKQLNADAEISSDGTTTLTEEIEAFREKSGEGVYLDHYYDSNVGESINKDSIQLLSGDGSLKPEFTQEGSKTRVRFKIWSKFSGTRTFKIKYSVKGFVKQLKDSQIFKRNFFNNNDSRPVMNAHINIKIPSMGFSNTKIQVDGLSNQNNIKKDAQTSTFSIDIPQSQHTKPYYEVNMSFANHTFANASPIPNASYQTLEQFDNEIAKNMKSDADQRESGKNIWMIFMVVLVCIGPLCMLILTWTYYKIGRQHRTINTDMAFWQLPADVGPAVASMIVSRHNQADLASAFKSGIMYLVCDGYIILEQIDNDVKITKQKELENTEMLPKEIEELYKYLFLHENVKVLSKNETFEKESEEAQQFDSYQNAAIASFQSLDLFDRDNGSANGSFKMSKMKFRLAFRFLVYIVIGFSFIGAGIFNLNYTRLTLAIALSSIIFMLSLVLIYYFRIIRVREEKIEWYEQWMGYKFYLSNYTLLRERNVADVALWKKHLVYATTFGVAEKIIEVLRAQYPEIYAEVDMTIGMNSIVYFSAFSTAPTLQGGRFDPGSSGGSFGGGSFGGGGSDGGGGGFF